MINLETSCRIYLPDSFVHEEEQLAGRDFLTLMLLCKIKSNERIRPTRNRAVIIRCQEDSVEENFNDQNYLEKTAETRVSYLFVYKVLKKDTH